MPPRPELLVAVLVAASQLNLSCCPLGFAHFLDSNLSCLFYSTTKYLSLALKKVFSCLKALGTNCLGCLNFLSKINAFLQSHKFLNMMALNSWLFYDSFSLIADHNSPIFSISADHFLSRLLASPHTSPVVGHSRRVRDKVSSSFPHIGHLLSEIFLL